MRTIVYVDGFNLYYGSLKGHQDTRWLDLLALSTRLLPVNQIDEIVYCTAFVRPSPGNPDQLKRQKLYVAALRTLGCVTIYKGAYIQKTKRRPWSQGKQALIRNGLPPLRSMTARKRALTSTLRPGS